MKTRRCSVRHMSSNHCTWSFACVVLAGILLIPGLSWAQQVSSYIPPEQEKTVPDPAAGRSDSDRPSESSSRPPAIPGAAAKSPELKTLRKAKPLDTAQGRLRWGPLSVRSIEFLQIINRIDFADGSPGLTQRTNVLGIDIVYDRRFPRSRLAIQYQARIPVLEQPVRNNRSDQVLGIDLHYYLTPRWTLTFTDHLDQQGSRNLYGDSYVETDQTTGEVVVNNFLARADRYLSNTTLVNLGYQLSGRTELDITPSFTYSHTTGSALQPLPLSGRSYGGQVSLTHVLSPRTNVGVFYSAERSQFSGGFANTTYQTFGGRFSRQLTATWFVTSTLGATREYQGTEGKLLATWTYYADMNLNKRFRRSLFWLAYGRSHNGGFLTNRIADRADLGYGGSLTRKMQANVSIGYFRETGIPPRISGKYATVQLSYRVSPTLSVFVNYTRQHQLGDGAQLLRGTQNVATTGIRWEPRHTSEAY